MMDRQRSIKVLMFPWLAHGHISPFLELAKQLTKRNFQIYLCSTPINLNSIKPTLSECYATSITMVELNLPSLPDLPPHYHTTKGLPPNLMPTLKKAFDMASPAFSNILHTVKPDLLIYDFLQPWAPQLASSMNIPAVIFSIFGAAIISFLLHGDDRDDKFSEISPSNSVETCYSDEHIDLVLKSVDSSNSFFLIKSFRELEGKYLDYLSLFFGKKVVPVGPLVAQDPDPEDHSMDIINWLNKKEESSTVFVTFGSECYLTREEMEEVAYGLELSKVNFIWVVRFPFGQKMELEEALPKGFLERVGEKGMVVEDWAPQMKILGHSSIGGFVSHCGWSSVIESLKFGVPIIAMPMQLDQPINAKVVEGISAGLEVKRDKNRRIERENLAKVIREIVVEKSRQDIGKKAREMSDVIREKGEEEMDNVVEELAKLCEMYN